MQILERKIESKEEYNSKDSKISFGINSRGTLSIVIENSEEIDTQKIINFNGEELKRLAHFVRQHINE